MLWRLQTFIGGCCILLFIYKLLILIYHVLRPAKDLSKYGEWSIITGGTDGIGKAIAYKLAGKGQNILIVGRNINKLTASYQYISNSFKNIIVEYCEIDFSDFNDKAQLRYIDAIQNKNIGILINNAGLFYKIGKCMHKLNQEFMLNMMKVNNSSLVLITYLTLPYLLKKKRKHNRGCIVNISSGTSLLPAKHFSIYAATKCFLNKWNIDLNSEYKNNGIIFQSQICGQVMTKMLPELKNKSLFVIDTMTYAKYSIKHIGYQGICSPYPSHAILFFFIDLLPQIILNYGIHIFWKIYFVINSITKQKKS